MSETMTAEEAIGELVGALEWGLKQFKAFADHRMSCACWGPTASVDPDACRCGVRDAIKKAEKLIAKYTQEQGGEGR